LVNAGSVSNPSEIISHFGETVGRRLVVDLGEAPAVVRRIIKHHAIDCDLHDKGVIKGAHSVAALRGLEDHVRQWRALGAPLELLDRHAMIKLTGSARYVGGIVDHRS